MTKASQKAAPAELQIKSIGGSDSSTGQLSLRVAEPTKSKGLVHRHVVMIQQNSRQVNHWQLLDILHLSFYRHYSVTEVMS